MDFGGKADKRHFDRAERVKCKALRVSAQGVYFRLMTKCESRKQRSNWPAMQRSQNNDSNYCNLYKDMVIGGKYCITVVNSDKTNRTESGYILFIWPTS
ncbi:hypothetical protein [Porphyromonas pogonae]|uniref:hypothetical protein n=1 Tax=Porphyromonas pogonae TaxID=867595 RepID=UPI002E790F36|nr:hypothetical protein [Porphyromonas pogonae]